MPAKKECFVISPIGQEGSDVRREADTILEYVIKPVVAKFGYAAIRADQLGEPGDIGDQVIRHLCEAPLTIANLSGSNPNVYYEMAVRHTLAKPLIPIAPKGASLPFDVGGIRTVFVDLTSPRSVEEAKRAIGMQIEGFEGAADTTVNPVTRVISQKTRQRIERIHQLLDEASN